MIPQLLWFRRMRDSLPLVFVIVICRQHRHVVRTLCHHRYESSIGTSCHRVGPTMHPTLVEIATFIGSFGLFFSCFLIFCRIAPVIAIAEIKGAAHLKTPESRPHGF